MDAVFSISEQKKINVLIMKKILLFLILVISVNTIFADPTPKQKKIKFGKISNNQFKS